jgi:hypothetical protein
MSPEDAPVNSNINRDGTDVSNRREADITFAAVNVVVGPQAIAADTRRNAGVVTIGADSLTVR